MRKVMSEDAVRRGLAKIDEAAGLRWLQTHLDYCVWPLLSEPWVLDIDSTIKPLYGRQEGAVVSYNPHKPGRPSHCYHTYLMANLRLALGVDVQPGDEHTPKHGQAGLWSLLHRLGRSRWPALLRGHVAWGVEEKTERNDPDWTVGITPGGGRHKGSSRNVSRSRAKPNGRPARSNGRPSRMRRERPNSRQLRSRARLARLQADRIPKRRE